MSFQRYPEYKDSAVEWLGEVPVHWTVCGTGHRLKSPPCYGVLVPDFDPDGVPMLKIMDLANGTPDRSALATISQTLSNEFQRTIVRPGDVVLSVVGTIGTVLVVPEALEGINLSRALARLLPNGDLLPQWLVWIFSSDNFVRFVDLVCVGSAQRVLNMDDLRSFRAPFPPIEEQTAIATFLDHETAKIDALVAEQEKLIALLQEKRQAVISHAVTKGLNPNAPMKDSGVEWLGEVPAHWEAITLRRCVVAVQTGGTPSADVLSESLDEGFVWYTPGDFGSSLKLSTSTRRIANEAVTSGEAKVFPPQSVLIVGIGATLGKVGFAQDTSSANQQINAVIPSAKVDGYFLAWSLSVKTESMRFLSNASTIGIMNQEKTKEIWIALPPREEQMAISIFLDQETAKLDTLMAEARTAITLLQERRTALISAAVTGQIDVRGLVGGVNTPD